MQLYEFLLNPEENRQHSIPDIFNYMPTHYNETNEGITYGKYKCT